LRIPREFKTAKETQFKTGLRLRREFLTAKEPPSLAFKRNWPARSWKNATARPWF
jgi:hypothetical protein